MRSAIAALICVAVLTSNVGIAGAENGGDDSEPTATATTENGSPEAIVVSSPDGSRHEAHHSGSGYKGHWDCHYYEVGGSGVNDLDIHDGSPPINPSPGQLVGLQCVDDSGGIVYSEIFQYDPGNPFGPLEAPERAADEARKLLPLGPPNVELSPPVGATQLVGLATWFWVTEPWQPLQASATLDTVTSTVVATPRTLTFTFDDGTTFTCDGPGTRYDTTRDPADQQSDCTHTFERAGSTVVTATITYATAWTATTGVGGTRDDLTRTTTIPIVIAEAQAVIH